MTWWRRYYAKKKEQYDAAEPYDVAVDICDEAMDAGEISDGPEIDLGIQEISSALKRERNARI